MVRKGMLLSAALALAVVAPAVAAPTVKATVSHMCCGMCETAIKAKSASLGTVTTDRPSKAVTVMGKDGMDVMTVINTLGTAGFPPTALMITGAKSAKMDVGHLCCGGCAGPLGTALKNAGYTAEVKPNQPVMLSLTDSTDCVKLISVMRDAGFAPTTFVLAP